MRDYRSDGEQMADEAMQAAIMVCQVCKKPTPPGRYWFHSNAAGENLGGIFCSKVCVDTDKSPTGFLPNDYFLGDQSRDEAGLV